MTKNHHYYKNAQYQCAKDKQMHKGPCFLYNGQAHCLEHYLEHFKKPDIETIKKAKEVYVQTEIR